MQEFEKIIGYKNVRIELERLCDILQNPERYRQLGVSTPKGLLLHGEPGVGKTLMAKCLVKASGRKEFFLRKNLPDGEFVKDISETFPSANKSAPSIVFLDDMDKFANDDHYHPNSEEFVTLQSCIDDCKDSEVFVIATANSLESVPDSLIRAGRFDKSIKICAPKGTDAVEIIEYYLSKKKFVDKVNPSDIAKIMAGRSCAELETVINEAGVYAGFEGKKTIGMQEIVRAAMRIVFNAPENLETTDENALRAIAYHEAGHAVVAEVLEPGSVGVVSVLSHDGNKGGITAHCLNENYWIFAKYMRNRVISLLGGKAATEIVYGDVDAGAGSDLDRAYDITERIITDYCPDSFDKFVRARDSSDEHCERRDMSIACELDRYYATAKRILIENRNFLDEVAKKLFEKKTLLSEEIIEIKNSTLAA